MQDIVLQTYYEILFDDCTYSDNMLPEDIMVRRFSLLVHVCVFISFQFFFYFRSRAELCPCFHVFDQRQAIAISH